jgi:hypothetical protein
MMISISSRSKLPMGTMAILFGVWEVKLSTVKRSWVKDSGFQESSPWFQVSGVRKQNSDSRN